MNTVQPSLDFDALKEVQGVMGADFPLLVESFFNDSVNLLIVMQKSIDESDVESLRQAAHSFKGSAGNMSAITLAALCQDLEGLAFSGTTVGGGQLITQIVAEYKQVKAALEDI
ncbi:MAG: Hpt domain-containing protein [Oceanicoccus sp.]